MQLPPIGQSPPLDILLEQVEQLSHGREEENPESWEWRGETGKWIVSEAIERDR